MKVRAERQLHDDPDHDEADAVPDAVLPARGSVVLPGRTEAAPNTFFPRFLNSVSSAATVIAAPSGSSVLTISRARYMPRVSVLHAAREKNLCARSCDQDPTSPVAVNIPVTVPLPVFATSPAASTRKVASLAR